MHVAVIGTGYVGLTTGVALAFLGHRVTAIDTDTHKLQLLARNIPPIYEPGLEQLLALVHGRLALSSDTSASVADADVIFIAVGTPPKANGEADIRYLEDAAREICRGLPDEASPVVVIKSTVPIGTNRGIAHLMQRTLAARGTRAELRFVANPEFLRESVALKDTLYPDRIVIGTLQPEAIGVMVNLYRPLLEQTFTPPNFLPRPEGYRLPHLITTDPTSAEMIKYAANAYLPVKISFINEIAGLCEKVGADVSEVARGIGLDPRIGSHFLEAGLGWGGSCFPKDTRALLSIAGEFDYPMPLLQAAREVNERQRLRLVEKVQSAVKVLRGRVIGVLGLAFKPNTDDVRESPAVEIIRILAARGAHVRVHDPVAMTNARTVLADVPVEFAPDPYALAADADALILATEWREYLELDWPRLARTMKTPVLVDGRNLIPPDIARQAGLHYMGIGR